MKIADFLANRPVICGSLPLGSCTGEFLVDHIKAGLTRSCDARLLPATKALHRDRLRHLRGKNDARIIRYVREHKTKLADCRVEKSASGSLALQSPICLRLRESGYLLAQLNVSGYRGLVAETEAELGCEYEKLGNRDKMASRSGR
jgi:hypothetical protein